MGLNDNEMGFLICDLHGGLGIWEVLELMFGVYGGMDRPTTK